MNKPCNCQGLVGDVQQKYVPEFVTEFCAEQALKYAEERYGKYVPVIAFGGVVLLGLAVRGLFFCGCNKK